VVQPLERDRILSEDIETIVKLVRNGKIIRGVEREIGVLW